MFWFHCGCRSVATNWLQNVGMSSQKLILEFLWIGDGPEPPTQSVCIQRPDKHGQPSNFIFRKLHFVAFKFTFLFADSCSGSLSNCHATTIPYKSKRICSLRSLCYYYHAHWAVQSYPTLPLVHCNLVNESMLTACVYF